MSQTEPQLMATVQIPAELRDDIKDVIDKHHIKLGKWIADACREKLQRQIEQNKKIEDQYDDE